MENAGFRSSHERVVDGRVRRVHVAAQAGRDALIGLRAVVAEMAGDVLPSASGNAAETAPHEAEENK